MNTYKSINYQVSGIRTKLFYVLCFVAIAFCLMIMPSCKTHKEHADYIYTNGKVYTVDDKLSICQSFAIAEGKFIASGTNEYILTAYTSENIIDLKGKTVYPGLIDGYSHFLRYALNLQYADLSKAKSFDEVIYILKAFHVNNPSDWILGVGWNENNWDKKVFPDNKILDKEFPYYPVAIERIDEHTILANSLALKKADITKEKQIEGGKIIVKKGEMTGLLIDKAADIMYKRAFIANSRKKAKALIEAQYKCFATGLTTIVEGGLDKKDIDIIDTLQSRGKLFMRVYALITGTDKNLQYYFNSGTYKTNSLDVRSIKLFADGTLGSRSALLLKPYSDDTGNYGNMMRTPKDIALICRQAYLKGFQVCTHAIGDSAVRNVLQIYADILRDYNAKRWIIEHAQVVNPADMHYFKRYSIIPSVQTVQAISDMNWSIKRLGPERIKDAYAYKRLLSQTGWIINGTDFPIEDMSPILNFYSAVTRKDVNGYPPNGFQSEDVLTKEDALKAMTIWAAKGCFEEREKGSIEPGKLADFIITDKDFMTIPINEVPGVKVISTYIGGVKVYGRTDVGVEIGE